MDIGAAPGASPQQAARLAHLEANLLAAALVSRLAADDGARVLVIKGLSLEHHGLRPGYVSADIDVLVEAGRCEELKALLVEVGWQVRPTTKPGLRLPHHSDTMFAAQWPNDVDVHSMFPGLLVDPQEAFDVMWERRVQAVFAGQPCWVPDRSSAIVLWALHSLRSTVRQYRHEAELSQIVTDVLPSLSPTENRELSDRIVQLGAVRPLCQVREFAAMLDGRRAAEAEGAYEAWGSLVAQTHSSVPFLELLRGRPVSDWPWLIRWGLWPSRADLKVIDPSLVDTPLGRLRARGRRSLGFIGRLGRTGWGWLRGA